MHNNKNYLKLQPVCIYNKYDNIRTMKNNIIKISGRCYAKMAFKKTI